MKHVALDLWEDLREKRLWPVAAALLLAVIANRSIRTRAESLRR